MLSLSASDLNKLINYKELADSMEAAILMYDMGEINMPNRMHIDDAKNTLLLMPSFAHGYSGTKIVNINPSNKDIHLPIINGLMLLSDTSGLPITICNGSTLTALRTGAVGALGIRYTTPKTINTLGIVGTGVQGIAQALFACAERNIQVINVYNRSTTNQNHFVKTITAVYPNVQINICDDVNKVVVDSELIITTTNSLEPVLPNDIKLLKGKHIIAIGSYKPNMRELPDAVFELAETVYVDTPFATEESGDVKIPIEKGLLNKTQISTLSKLMQNKMEFDENKVTVFKSVGMAAFDLYAIKYFYDKAIKNGLGTNLEM